MTADDLRQRKSVPPDLRRFLRGTYIHAVRYGGSGSLVFTVDSQRGRRVVKYVPRRMNAVDGHEAADLMNKARQVRLIHEVAPSLRRPVPFVDYSELVSGNVLTAPEVRGTSPVAPLLHGDIEAFSSAMRSLLELIGAGGYGQRSSVPHDPGAPYMGRVARRVEYLTKHAPLSFCRDLQQTTGIGLSEVPHLVGVVARDRQVLPTRLYFPVHGDMNLLNVLVGPGGELKLIDQRGVLEDWDPIYDLGKMLFTVWLHAGLELGIYRTVGDRSTSAPGAVVAHTKHNAYLRAGAHALQRAISQWDFGGEFSATPQRLWERVIFAASVHAVSEAACRVSVAKSWTCRNPLGEVLKAKAYLHFGVLALQSIKDHDNPNLPQPRMVH